MSAVTGTRTARTMRAVAATTSLQGAFSPSAKPSAQATPPLVVATAPKPAASNWRALMASQAFGRSRAARGASRETSSASCFCWSLVMAQAYAQAEVPHKRAACRMACERRGQIAKSGAMKAPKPPRDSKLAVDEMTRAPGQARARAARGRDQGARRALLPEGCADRLATPNTTRCGGATRRSRRGFPTCARWTACRARSALRRRAASPRCGTRCRCCRCDNAFSEEDVADFVEPHPPLPQSEGGRDARVHRRAEDRRPVDVAALRGRRAGQGRDPRRRRRGRGRHRQHPHAEGGAAQAQGQGHPGGLRGARRDLHDQGRLPRAQQAAGRGRRAAFRQSAQHRRPARCARRTRASPRRGRCISSPMPGAR